MFRYLLFLSLVLLSANSAAAESSSCRIFLAGDSTMQIVDPERNPDFGWGQVLPASTKLGTKIENRAKGGRSTKTFISEGRWQGILNDLNAGDWVLIQFGHNDASYQKPERYTAPVDFEANLRRFVEQARAEGGKPVLLTPVARRWFDSEGKLRDVHGIYPSLVRRVAEDMKVPLIDLFESSSNLLMAEGVEASRALFAHVEPGEHSCCPEGREDNTHFSKPGALEIAKLVVKEIQTRPIEGLAGCFKPQQQNWQSLFNGKDIDDWIVKIHNHELGDNYANTFRVQDGVLQVNYDDYEKFGERYGHLFFKQPFSSFHLRVEYRFTDQWLEDAPYYTELNSGIMFHSQDPNSILKEQDWPISVEYQMLARLEDGKPRPTGNMCSPGTAVVFNGELDLRHCIESSSETYEADEWITAELIVRGSSLVTHLVNGEKVLEYSQPQIGGGLEKDSDPALKQDGKLLKQGYIGLQSEGQGIEFRKVEIKNLAENQI